MVTCMGFVFISMVEFVVVCYLFKQEKTAMAYFVENVMKVLLPLGFIIFNIFYWFYITKT
jgi:hypothetical protein